MKRGDVVMSVPGERADDYDPERVTTRAEFGQLLTAIRVRAGLTVRELARRLEVPAGTLGDYFSGRHLPSSSQLPTFRGILAQCGVVDDALLDQWVTALQRVRAVSDGRASRRPAPYRGLEAFSAADADLFFGREELATAIVERLRAIVAGPSRPNPVVAVIGASGSGKSSLLRAGVLPAVEAGALGKRWRGLLMTPGADPEAAFEECTSGLGEAHAVVVIDQFEEIFTLCSPEVRRAFLATLARRGSDDCLVAFSLRADFFGHAAREEELLTALAHEQLLVSPMGREQLRRAITEPARRVGMSVEDGLAELLLADLAPAGAGSFAHNAGALPLLSHALFETWQHATHNALTVADYKAAGGLDGAVSQTAEELYADLEPAEQNVARRIFTRMVNVDEDGLVTRRRVSRAEVDALLAETDGATTSLANLFERFVARRLLTVEADTVEISHETLLTAWPRLRDWVDEDREELRGRRRIVEAARNWEDSGHDASLLLSGRRLDAAVEYAADADRRRELTQQERDFVEASATHAAARRLADQRRTRRLKQLLAAVIVLAVVASGFAAFALDQRARANHARDEALSRQVAIEATQLRDSAPSLSAQLALAAYRLAPTTEAQSALLDSSSTPLPTRLLGASGPTAIALSKDGTLLAVSHADDGTVHLYRRNETNFVSLGVIPGSPNTQVFAVAMNPANTLLATGGTSDHIELWDVSNPSQPRRLTVLGGFTTAVQSITFSGDGKTLLAAGDSAGVHRWNVRGRATPEPILPDLFGSATIQSVEISGDGRWIAGGGTDGTLHVWDDRSARQVATAATGASSLTAVAFSPDATLLAAASKDHLVHLWAIDGTGQLHQAHDPLSGFTSWVNSLAFAPNGGLLAAGSSDNTVRVWSTDSWTNVATFDHPVPVTGTVFTPDGQTLISSGADGAVRLWPLKSSGLTGFTGNVFALSYDADGALLAGVTSGPQGSATLWNTKGFGEPHDVVPPSGFGPTIGSGALTPDGHLLAIANRPGQIQLFDVRDPAHAVPVGSPLTGAAPLIESVTISPSGTLLAAGDDSGVVRLWNIAHPAAPQQLPALTGPGSIVLAVTFSPNSSLLAAASADKNVWLWNISDPAHPAHVATLTGFANYAYSVAFTPDGHTLAAGSADHTVRLWDVSDPAHPKALGKPLTGPTDYVYYIAVSPDGSTLAAATTAHRVFMWDISHRSHPKLIATLGSGKGQFFAVAFAPTKPVVVAAGTDPAVSRWSYQTNDVEHMICDDTGDPITRAEWAQYVPGAHYDPPCH